MTTISSKINNANKVKRNICDIKNSISLENNLPTSVNDRLIASFHKGFHFSHENF